MPPGAAEVSDRHSKAQQYFFVLNGALTMESVSGTLVLRAREGAHIPPGVIHTARNNSGEPVEFLVISEPPSHGDKQLAE